jgi:hypothetical protein
MNLFKIIQELQSERKRLDKAIAAMEDLAQGKTTEPEVAVGDESEAAAPPKKRRGRPRKNQS